MAQSWYTHLRGRTVLIRDSINLSRNSLYLIDIVNVTLLYFSTTIIISGAGTGADRLHRPAADQAAPRGRDH